MNKDEIGEYVKKNYYYKNGSVYSEARTSPVRGEPLGWSQGTHFQITIRIKSKRGKMERKNILRSHIVWFLHHDVWPKKLIDHRDLNSHNDRIENLREATPSQNIANQSPRKTRQSRFKGVHRTTNKINPYTAYIGYDGKRRHIGVFKTEYHAARAYNRKALELFGEFANLNPV